MIGIVGVAGSGKTQLAIALQARLAAAGRTAALVAAGPSDACGCIDAAAARHAVVVVDVAVPPGALPCQGALGSTHRPASAESVYTRCDLALLSALDLPWQDGGDRSPDGLAAREGADTVIRTALQRIGTPFVVVSGRGEARVRAGWRAVQQALRVPPAADAEDDAGGAPWRWHCERCGDAACERRTLLPSAARR